MSRREVLRGAGALAGLTWGGVRVPRPRPTGGPRPRRCDELWSLPLPEPTSLRPVLAGGRVYVGVREEFLALDAGTGRRVWQQPLPRTTRGGWTAVAAGHVALMHWHSSGGKPKRPLTYLRILDPPAGTVRWEQRVYRTRSASQRRVGVFGAHAVTTICTGPDAYRVSAYRLADGTRDWSSGRHALPGGPPAPGPARLLLAAVPEGRTAVLLDLATGRPSWVRRDLALTERGAAVDLGTHLFATTRPAAVPTAAAVPAVTRLDAATGATGWQVGFGGAAVDVLAAAGGQVHIGVRGQGLHTRDAGTGGPRWHWPLPPGDLSLEQLAVGAGRVCVLSAPPGGRPATLHILDATTGAPCAAPFPDVHQGIAADDATLVFQTDDPQTGATRLLAVALA
ncbi:outer membrane protein assembly factor BamB family protein [Pilimelia terevasa]|uniref:outer membrane protein assembly factor BamB family protein n=1 Tax=Pilimelia terevasa TaxID=53372 RepID=UPI00166F6477|nr:PQQ-binding-like beta-propeller repeat protein [Pilimelia terevasa]